MQKGKVDLAKYQDAIRLLSDSSYKYCGYQGYCFIEQDKVVKIYRKGTVNNSDLSNLKSDRIAYPEYYILKKEQLLEK